MVQLNESNRSKKLSIFKENCIKEVRGSIDLKHFQFLKKLAGRQ